jgi:hypothetical protein
MSEFTFAGTFVIGLGIALSMFGIWRLVRGTRTSGTLPSGSREIVWLGSALAVAGFGVMMLGIELIVIRVLGLALLVQAVVMTAVSTRLTKWLR